MFSYFLKTTKQEIASGARRRSRPRRGGPDQPVALRGSSVKLGTMQRRLAWPLRKDDMRKSRSVNNALRKRCPRLASRPSPCRPGPSAPRRRRTRRRLGAVRSAARSASQGAGVLCSFPLSSLAPLLLCSSVVVLVFAFALALALPLHYYHY